MHVDAQHRLDKAAWLASPHWDARPAGMSLELIVLHCISLPEGQFGTGLPEALFLGTLDVDAHPTLADLEGVRVAPHVLIERGGEVRQFVSFDKRAWHAGVSSWRHRVNCNDYAIGIELEGAVGKPYELAQYDALADVLAAVLSRYPTLSVQSIVGHNEIAPQRKQDPGPFFDWRGLLLALHTRMDGLDRAPTNGADEELHET